MAHPSLAFKAYDPTADEATNRTANAVVSVEFVDEYLRAENRLGENGWNGDTPAEQKQAAIIAASQYMETSKDYYGDKLHPEQVLPFPRQAREPAEHIPTGKRIAEADEDGNLPFKACKSAAEYAVRAFLKKLWEDHPSVSTGSSDIDEETDYTSTVTEGTIKKVKSASGAEVEFEAPGTIHRNNSYHANYSRVSEHFVQDPYPAADNLLREFTKQTTAETQVIEGDNTGCPVRTINLRTF